MSKSDLRYLIAELIGPNKSSVAKKYKCFGTIRIEIPDPELAIMFLPRICDVKKTGTFEYFQGYGLDDDDSAIILVFGGNRGFLDEAELWAYAYGLDYIIDK